MPLPPAPVVGPPPPPEPVPVLPAVPVAPAVPVLPAVPVAPAVPVVPPVPVPVEPPAPVPPVPLAPPMPPPVAPPVPVAPPTPVMTPPSSPVTGPQLVEPMAVPEVGGVVPSRQVGAAVLFIGLVTCTTAPVALIDISVIVGPPAGSTKVCPAAVRPVKVVPAGVVLRSSVQTLLCWVSVVDAVAGRASSDCGRRRWCR